MIDYRIEKLQTKQARDYIKENHYSKTCQAGPILSLGLFDKEELIGVLMFGTPIGESVRASVFGKEYKDHVTELHRLHIKDCTPRNTESWFISRCLKLLKIERPEIWAVLSFSDTTQGHTGVIYQATNAYRIGKSRPAILYLDREGKIRHHRQDGKDISPETAQARGWVRYKNTYKNRYLWLLPDSKKHKKFLFSICKYNLNEGKE